MDLVDLKEGPTPPQAEAPTNGTEDAETKASGKCAVCDKDCHLRCQACLYQGSGRQRVVPFYCSKDHQKEHWLASHKRTCVSAVQKKYQRAITKPTRPLDDLIRAIKDDRLPAENSPSYNCFGFANCRNEEEESKLLSLYVGLINLLECDLDELHQACIQGRLAEFIKKEYEGQRPDPENRGAYYPWFLENQELVNNPYSSAN